MNIYTIAAAATAAVIGTAAIATNVDDLVAELEAKGYTNIEVETESNGEIEVEGIRQGIEREIVLAADGTILSDMSAPEGEDDNDDDNDDEDEDDDAEGEDQDENDDEDEDEDADDD